MNNNHILRFLIRNIISESNLSSELRAFNNANDLISYLSSLYKIIGKGIGRTVFRVNGDYVVKVAHAINGIEQNRKEINNKDKSKLFPEILEYDDKNLWLIVENVFPIDNLFDKIIEHEFYDVIKAVYDKIDGRATQFNHWIIDEIIKLNKECGLDLDELSNKNHWGMNVSGDIKIIDGGQ